MCVTRWHILDIVHCLREQHVRSSVSWLSFSPLSFAWSSQGMSWWERWELHIQFWLESLKLKDHVRDYHRCTTNSEIDLNETGCMDVYWTYQAQDRFQWKAGLDTVMNLQVSWKVGNFLTSWATINILEMTALYSCMKHSTWRSCNERNMLDIVWI